MKKFRDKILVITGGNKGIGGSVVDQFISEGGSVINFHKTENKKFRNNYQEIIIDLERSEDLKKVISIIPNKIDYLVLNASFYLKKDFDKYEEEDIKNCLNVNLNSSILLCRYLGSKINKGGSIIFISSSAGRTLYPGSSVYAATQAGIEAYAKVLAKELAPNVRVNVVAPGPTNTDLLKREIKGGRTIAIDKLKKNTPLNKIAQPKDIADGVIFLISEKARHITGQVLSINGGSQI